MKKKSLWIIALIVVMAFASLMVACGSGNEPAADTDRQTTATTQEIEKTDATAGETEEAAKATAEATKATEAANATETTKAKSSSDKKSDTNTSTKESEEQTIQSNTNATEATEEAKVCYITVDGYCSGKKMELKGGETVYDILKATGVSVSARSTGYGVYIEGINGRYEFDEGPTSGWIYTVNGSRPSTSCNKYEAKNGDKIVWTYVTEM